MNCSHQFVQELTVLGWFPRHIILVVNFRIVDITYGYVEALSFFVGILLSRIHVSTHGRDIVGCAYAGRTCERLLVTAR